MVKREISVYSFKGERFQNIVTDAATWGQLKKEIKGIEFSDTQAIISENEHTLQSDNATLPEFGFTLFITAVKVSNGSDGSDGIKKDYKYLRNYIKGVKESGGQEAATFFGNYVNKSTEELYQLAISWTKRKQSLSSASTTTVPIAKTTSATATTTTGSIAKLLPLEQMTLSLLMEKAGFNIEDLGATKVVEVPVEAEKIDVEAIKKDLTAKITQEVLQNIQEDKRLSAESTWQKIKGHFSRYIASN